MSGLCVSMSLQLSPVSVNANGDGGAAMSAILYVTRGSDGRAGERHPSPHRNLCKHQVLENYAALAYSDFY